MADTGASLPKQAFEDLFNNVYSSVDNDTRQAFPLNITPYTVKDENWYKTIPYALRVVEIEPANQVGPPISALGAGAKAMYFFFPVNPEAISINTPFATVVTPTLGGIVQEHSGPVFYNITINGTTGVIPSLDHSTGVPRNADTELRPLASQDGLIPSFPGSSLFGNTIDTINSAVSAITGTSAKMASNTQNRKSGYTAFHVLYKFLWLYHFAKSNGAKQQLRFMNYKDNNQYDCVVESFTLTRDKSRPHLYQYTIQLKGWLLANVDSQLTFTPASDYLKSLGLDEGPSAKALMFRTINDTKTVLNGASGLLNAAAGDLAF